MNYIDKVANLLATENLSVVRKPVQTASFDVKSRILTLPQWKDMSTDLETMLVGHEIGHALYTSIDMIENIKEYGSGFHSFVNVIEDARIEKLVKRLYPGMIKYFISGYKDLDKRDLFGIRGKDVNELPFIDRVNLYFKLGIFCGVKFNSEELTYVKRIELAETEEEVLQIARELYDLEKERKEKQKEEIDQQMKDMDSEEGDEEGDEFSESDNDESMETDDDVEEGMSDHNYSAGTSEEYTDEPISETQENMTKNIQEMADPDSIHVEYELLEDYGTDPVIKYKQVLEETSNTDPAWWMSSEEMEQVEPKFLKFMQDSTKVVNYLVKQFELKKSADQYKRAKVSKTGSLDMKKVFAYKLKDDIFKQITSIADSKNHGMVFLLDWSASMDRVIHDTVKQLISLAMFCRKTQIPFRVVAFSNCYKAHQYDTKHYGTNAKYKELLAANKIHASIDYRLLEFLSSDMSNKDFTEMCRRLFDTARFYRCNGVDYNLYGTPLNDALRYMLKYVPEFTRSANVQKMTLITLSDGEGFQSIRHLPRHNEERKYITNFIVDPVTNKRYKMPDSTYNGSKQSAAETDMYIDMIKTRHNIKVIGFFVCPNTKFHIKRAIFSNRQDIKQYYSDTVSEMTVAAKKSFRESGYYNLPKTTKDAMFVVPLNKMKGETDELVADDSMTPRSIARAFTKFMTKQTTSKVLLDRFVDIIA